jgi:hypothetical protein
MSRRQTLGTWLSTSDAALSWGERIVKWLVIGLGSGTISGLAGTVIGFWANNLVYGLVIGVVLGMLLLGGFALKAISIAAAGAPPALAPTGQGKSSASREASEARIRRLETDNGALHEQIERLTSERDELLERLQAQTRASEPQPGDEVLKSECFQMSTACYQFVRDHGGTEMGDYLDPEVRRLNDEVMLEYEQALGGRVNGLLRKLQRRGWWQPETVDHKKRKNIEERPRLSF